MIKIYFLFSEVNVCPGDSGGGLVFEEPNTKAYYLRGIVSLGTKGCRGQEFALFTKLSSHRELVEKYLRLEWFLRLVKNIFLFDFRN